MSQTIWEWLGIEETTDKSLIRKAYAEQSKIYHPEDCPEEARKLREAYKKAMELSSSGKNTLRFSQEEENKNSNHKEWSYEYRLSSPESGKEKESSGKEKEPSGKSKKEPSGQGDRERSYEYRLSSPESGKEKEPSGKEKGPSGQGDRGRSYEYRLSSPESGKEKEPSGKEKEPSGQGDKERLYEYYVLAADSDRKQGIHELARQLVFLYGRSDYRQVPRVWRFVFENYPRKNDLRDPRMIAELVSVIEQMPYLANPVWRVLEEEIFRYSGGNADWMLLKDRFRAVKQGADIHQLKRANQWRQKKSVSSLLLAVSKELYGEGSRVYKKYRFREMAVGSVIMVIGVCVLGGALYWSSEAQEYRRKAKQQEIVENWRQEIRIVQEDNGNGMPGLSYSREYFQSVFTQERPYTIDLNNDTLPDHVYYAPEQDCFVAALYDSATDSYCVYGTVEQYLEEYPDMRNTGFLSLLILGGPSEGSEE